MTTIPSDREPFLTDEQIGAWTSTHDEIAWGQSVIPTHLVAERLRELRDEAQARIDALEAENTRLLAACERALAWLSAEEWTWEQARPEGARWSEPMEAASAAAKGAPSGPRSPTKQPTRGVSMSDLENFPYFDDLDDADEVGPRIRYWEIDDDGNVSDAEPPPDLGPCCACGKVGSTVRNILMLHKRAPTPGFGWGCFQCGLPMDGATAVLCDACLEGQALIAFVCDGYPGEGKRVPVASLSPELFDHDLSKHPEMEQL